VLEPGAEAGIRIFSAPQHCGSRMLEFSTYLIAVHDSLSQKFIGIGIWRKESTWYLDAVIGLVRIKLFHSYLLQLYASIPSLVNKFKIVF
jgi:hypothetical protein